MVEKIAKPLLKRIHTRTVHPVLVKAAGPQCFPKVLSVVRRLDLSRQVSRRLFLREYVPQGYYGPLPRFEMVSAILSARDIEALAEDPCVEKIYYDMPVETKAFPVVPEQGVYRLGNIVYTTTWWTRKILGADEANKRGWTGRGVKVAVPDTGVLLYHEQLGFRWASVEFDSVMPLQQVDGNGHGSWVCTCIGGGEGEARDLSRKTGKENKVMGMAPEAELYCIKCLGYLVGTGSTSQVAKAMELALEWGADIVSMSLGGPEEAGTPEDDPYYPILQKYIEAGVIPVIAAGNEGPEKGTISSPGALPQAVTVGAYDPIRGVVAEFSSRGPTPWGDTKPDICMPGVNILSGSTGMLDVAVDKIPDHYAILSGTSMATPHASGMLALMRQAHKEVLGKKLTAEEVKQMVSAWALEHGKTKDNNCGWGPVTWEVYTWWVSTQYGANV